MLILHAFGSAVLRDNNKKSAMHYYQKAMDIMISNLNEDFHSRVSELKYSLAMNWLGVTRFMKIQTELSLFIDDYFEIATATKFLPD